MSTRAVYTFIDPSSTHHVYKHHDGYPTGAAEFIGKALKNAWALPRFEADEFAAAFVAANKSDAGGVRLTHNYTDHADLEYRYEIRLWAGQLEVTAFSVRHGNKDKKIFSGPLAGFRVWAIKEE